MTLPKPETKPSTKPVPPLPTPPEMFRPGTEMPPPPQALSVKHRKVLRAQEHDA